MLRAYVGLGLLPVLLVAACNEEPTSPGFTESGGLAAASIEANPPGQVAGIEALIAAWEAAWESKDAAAYAANYAPHAEFINPIGGILPGREAIRAQHSLLFAGPFAQSVQTVTVRRTVFLTGSSAIVFLDMTFTGFAGLPGGLRPTEPGMLRGRLTWVVTRDGGEWQIVSQQMTPFPPLP